MFALCGPVQTIRRDQFVEEGGDDLGDVGCDAAAPLGDALMVARAWWIRHWTCGMSLQKVRRAETSERFSANAKIDRGPMLGVDGVTAAMPVGAQSARLPFVVALKALVRVAGLASQLGDLREP